MSEQRRRAAAPTAEAKRWREERHGGEVGGGGERSSARSRSPPRSGRARQQEGQTAQRASRWLWRLAAAGLGVALAAALNPDHSSLTGWLAKRGADASALGQVKSLFGFGADGPGPHQHTSYGLFSLGRLDNARFLGVRAACAMLECHCSRSGVTIDICAGREVGGDDNGRAGCRCAGFGWSCRQWSGRPGSS